jgi:hypothetical protein
LEYAITLAVELERPLDLGHALRFLPLVAAQKPEAHDGWSLRWLVRWASEAEGLGPAPAAA